MNVFVNYLDKIKANYDIYVNQNIINTWFSFDTDTSYVVVVKFNNVTIKNSENESTVMPDFYVAFLFSAQHKLINILGKQFTFTLPQWQSNYTFSHVRSSRNLKKFEGFCFGYGYMAPLISKSKNMKTEVEAAMLYKGIDSYIRWESLEGGPYRKLGHISQYSNLVSKIPPRHINIDDFVNYLLINIKIDFIKCGNHYEIVVLPFKPQDTTAFFDMFCVEINGQFYKLGNTNIDVSAGVMFPFKGQIVKEMIDFDISEQSKKMYLLNPNFKSYVDIAIKKRLQKVSRETVGYKKELDIVGKMSKSNRVSVRAVPF